MVMGKVQERVKKRLQSLYCGRATFYRYEEAYNEKTHSTETELMEFLADVPCRLSHDTFPAAGQTETVAGIGQGITLILDPEWQMEAGSVVKVAQHGKEALYECSGEAAVYASHQEIKLTLAEKRA